MLVFCKHSNCSTLINKWNKKTQKVTVSAVYDHHRIFLLGLFSRIKWYLYTFL